jgi:hypothetical protein
MFIGIRGIDIIDIERGRRLLGRLDIMDIRGRIDRKNIRKISRYRKGVTTEGKERSRKKRSI